MPLGSPRTRALA